MSYLNLRAACLRDSCSAGVGPRTRERPLERGFEIIRLRNLDLAFEELGHRRGIQSEGPHGARHARRGVRIWESTCAIEVLADDVRVERGGVVRFET